LPKECITIVHYSDEQLLAQVDAALEEEPEKKIPGFCLSLVCPGRCGHGRVSRLQYPTNARLIRVMCSARVPIKLIERAFERALPECSWRDASFDLHYITGNYACEPGSSGPRRSSARRI